MLMHLLICTLLEIIAEDAVENSRENTAFGCWSRKWQFLAVVYIVYYYFIPNCFQVDIHEVLNQTDNSTSVSNDSITVNYKTLDNRNSMSFSW